ncbi:hypothetical protein AK812_SmicGene346 [Symbiodinium microadriaticum]|uniref:Uncharacterized protein n=1 Tax=Symbiodinium microadriaticum TaxID=2951 RepID=A0A1Q9F6Y1_SYMMI|nr:hypothetical protein AK812_SmicGene346 [Symbiodinium microadriaticum]
MVPRAKPMVPPEVDDGSGAVAASLVLGRVFSAFTLLALDLGGLEWLSAALLATLPFALAAAGLALGPMTLKSRGWWVAVAGGWWLVTVVLAVLCKTWL